MKQIQQLLSKYFISDIMELILSELRLALTMDRCTVIVLSSNQARFFTLEESEWPEYESGPSLVEQSSLSPYPEDRKSPFWSAILKQNGEKGKAKHAPRQTFNEKFAQKITGEIISLIRVNQSSRLILVANPKLISLVRRFFTQTMFNNLNIQELHEDISHLSSWQIHNCLASKQLVPACQKVVYPG